MNSANLGPYGDAIMRELLPEVEKRFRGIGQGWARATYGGSTGGWESIAVQVFYPDDFNGAWTFCPDPVSFDRYTTVNIYNDTNAYYATGPWKRVPRSATRDAASNGIWRGASAVSYGSPLGHVVATQAPTSHSARSPARDPPCRPRTHTQTSSLRRRRST